MGKVEIINTTCYHTDDVMEIIHSALESTSPWWTSVKIRYLTKPTSDFDYKNKRWAKASSPRTRKYLDIGLLHPDKMCETVLDKIVASDATHANQRIANDLVFQIKCLSRHRHYQSLRDVSKSVATALTIRLVE